MLAALTVADGQKATVVLVGPREKPNGAMLVFQGDGSEFLSVPLNDRVDELSPRQLIEIACMQERTFGSKGLEPPNWDE